MDERTCGNCGAKSAAGAEYCWQCYARFGPPAAAPPPTVGPALTAALGRGRGAGTPSATMTEDPTITRWQPTHQPTRSRVLGWLVRGAVFAVAAVGGYVGYQWLFGGFPFPDEIAGQERVDSERAEDAAAVGASIGRILGVDMEMAFYGSEVTPVYVMFAFEVPESVSSLSTLAGSDLSRNADGSIPFQCRQDVDGASCFWERDGTVVGIGGGGTPGQLRPVARQVHADLD